MWTVVNFKIDDSVDFVPDFWLNKGMSAWPKKRANIISYIEKRIDPDSKPDEFNYFEARPLYKNIVDIKEARIKAKKAQLTSDLSSQTDNDDDHNQRTRYGIINQNNTSKTANKKPVPPTFGDSEESNFGDDFDIDQTFITMLNQSDKDDVSQSMNDVGLLDNIEISKQPSLQTNSSSRKKLKFENQNNESPPSQMTLNPASPFTPEVFLIPVNEHQSSSRSIQQPVNDQHKNKDIMSSICGIERNLTVIKHEIKNFHDRMDYVVKIQESILDKLSNIQPSSSFIEDSESDCIIFIDDDINFNAMEDKLANDKLFRSKVVKELSRLSGLNISETVRKIMQKLFSDNILSNYSYIGFKGKKTFSILQSCSIIFESIRKMKKYKDTPDIEIEKPIKNWMAQATPRLKKLQMAQNKVDTPIITEEKQNL